ncbi:MAG: FadR/GntR family transcriptional regulator [Bacteroidia bacterium]|nr:FadR/GntR family transcriptional regulator [Bacteroidia bacterium]
MATQFDKGSKKFFQEISLAKPSDNIIDQIRNLIRTGQLNPGDKLPPERKLVEQFGVGRGHVRDALKKLEFYGILKTLPQNGTVVSGLGVKALEGLITNVLQIEDPDFHSLVETRTMLEVKAVSLAAERRTDEDLVQISNALSEFRKKVEMEEAGVEEDLMFHLRIAEASKNSVLRSLSMIIFPDMVKYSQRLNICGDGRFYQSLQEHEEILEYIQEKNPEKAAKTMRFHLEDMLGKGSD